MRTRAEKHLKPLDLYCLKDGTLLCVLCFMAEHNMHAKECLPVDEASTVLRAQLGELNTVRAALPHAASC
jgi:hypothetical protein